MTEQPAVKTNGKEVTITGYGARDEVRAMAGRILAMLPGASKLTESERLALAQSCVALGLNPFNGEAWFISGRGPMVGIKGLRKKAHDQVKGNFWIDYREVIDADERERWGIEKGALAFEARLYDSENIRTYTDTIKQLMEARIPWEAVEKMVGTRPYTSGVGVLRAGEQTKMERVQCARKRAEANALKQRFDVPFDIGVEEDELPVIIDESVSGTDYTDPAAVAAQIDAEQEQRARDKAALFGDA